MRIFSSAKDSHIFLIKIMVYLHVYQHILNELCKRFSYFFYKNNGVFAYVVSIYLTSWDLNDVVRLTML